MDSNGHCTEAEEGGECRRDARRWIYVLTDGPGASSAARESCGGDSKAKVRYLGSRPTRNMSFATERETRTAAAWNAWQMLGEFCTAKVDFKLKRKRLQSKSIQGALQSGLCAFAGQDGSFTENEL